MMLTLSKYLYISFQCFIGVLEFEKNIYPHTHTSRSSLNNYVRSYRFCYYLLSLSCY